MSTPTSLLFIPKSYLAKEASHVEGFAKECAVVTHYRLKSDPVHGCDRGPGGQVGGGAHHSPTSETIIWNTYRGWMKSYRDLPLLINQWANVVRWEMRTRLFLRTAEFLWQEGHTAHATKEEADGGDRAHAGSLCALRRGMAGHAGDQGVKTASERFAGAEDTYCIEAMMQDGKACRPAPRTSWVRISPRPSTCSSPTRRTSRSMSGPPVGA
jgi:prolyl-tRNA synthetase